jgi:hypothetical protein
MQGGPKKASRGGFFSISFDRCSRHRRRLICADPQMRFCRILACNKRARKWSAQLSYLG